MPVTIQCPSLTCRAVLQIPDSARGKKIRCGKCNLCFVVPGGPARSSAKPKKPAKKS